MNKFLDLVASMKTDIAQLDSEKVNNEILAYQKNANEVENTTNIGYGKELVSVDTLTDKVYNTIPEYSNFLMSLPGFHGNNMGASVKVPVVGEIGFASGNAEWTTGAGIISQGVNRLGTGDVTITQAPMIISVDISKKLLNHSVTDIESVVVKEISKSAIRTMESMIINEDASDGATGNVNLDDAQPSVTFPLGINDHRMLLDNGIRKLALDGTVNIDYVDVGTLEFNDFINVRSLLGDNSADLDNLLLILNTPTYNKTLTLDEFKNQNNNGITSTITNGKLERKLAGVDFVVNRDFPLTEADGKVSNTIANNVKGGFAYLYKPAVQWGYGQSIEIDTVKIPGKGVSIIATVEFGFTIINKKAGYSDPSVALGINTTV